MIDTRIMTSSVADISIRGENIPVRKVLSMRSHPDNTGLIWISFGRDAADGACWPLNIGDGVPISEFGLAGLTNLDQINVLFKSADDILTVLFEA